MWVLGLGFTVWIFEVYRATSNRSQRKVERLVFLRERNVWGFRNKQRMGVDSDTGGGLAVAPESVEILFWLLLLIFSQWNTWQCQHLKIHPCFPNKPKPLLNTPQSNYKWVPLHLNVNSIIKKKKRERESERSFPGGPKVKNPSCNVGDMSSIPGQGTKIQHAMEQLSPWAVTTEPVCQN